MPVSAWIRLRRGLEREWLLLLFALLTTALALFDPQPLARYQRWLQVPTLAGLSGLLIAIQGIRDSGMVQHAALKLTARTHSLRMLGLLLVAAAALLSMVLTNDVSLFLIVPLTLGIGSMCNLPVVRTVVLEAMSVNAGSTLSPIGNPQNLLLWQHSQLSFLHFAVGMLPAATIMLTLVALFTLYWMPRGVVTFNLVDIDTAPVSRQLGAWSMLGLLGMVFAVDHGHALWGAALLLGAFAWRGRASLRRVDWLLLLAFAFIFLGLGHLAELPIMRQALGTLDWHQPLTLYASGIIFSQFISNVPATVLLLNHTPDVLALAAAVNVGGFGLAIGSMANLIALRLLGDHAGPGMLHRASIPLLLVCVPLVYMAMRWTHG